MSTVKAVNLQHPNSSNINMVLGADGSVSGGLPSPNRNLLYNGAMQVHQRGTSTAAIASSGYYTADRWSFVPSTFGTWTQSIENDAPSGSGFRKSFKILCTTANSSPSAGNFLLLDQSLEGQDVQRILKGTPSSQQLTLSFWVKSNVIGNYVVALEDNDNSRNVSATFSISTSGSWEKKSITFPADTSGPFDNDNQASLTVRFWLGAGSTYTSGTLQTTWGASTNASRAVGTQNLASATNNYWQITGVQLETGPAPTPFEFKPYAQELRDCQRYFCRIGTDSSNAYGNIGVGAPYSSTRGLFHIQFPNEMRVPPTSLTFSDIQIMNFGTTQYTVTNLVLSATRVSKNAALVDPTSSGLTIGQFCFIATNNSASGHISFNSEL